MKAVYSDMVLELECGTEMSAVCRVPRAVCRDAGKPDCWDAGIQCQNAESTGPAESACRKRAESVLESSAEVPKSVGPAESAGSAVS